jgi:predicted RND superfamily exporter protein
MYFHDWRGALRPTLTGIIAAFWGMGFIYLIGLALDPLMLVMPFLITARAVSHAIQMHDRYYEEFEKCGWNKRRAIVASFAELFVPTFSGVITDALGVLVIILVPVIMLQKLAITASWWILAITVSEMLLNPIVYYYLKAPEPELVVLRERGGFRRLIERFTHILMSRAGRIVTLGSWTIAVLIGLYFMRGLTIGDPTAASPLLWLDSPYNVSHTQIQERFGGVEPLIVVAEGFDKDAMKDPMTLRTMERFQRQLERDPGIGYSFSLADIIRAVNGVFHELEPKWRVIPDSWTDIGGLFFIFFSGSPPTETAKYVDPSYTTAHVTFFAKNHQGDTIRRIIKRCQLFIDENPMDKAAFKLAGGLIGVLAAANEELVRNDILMNFLGFFTIWVILLFTYRSFACGLYLLGPLIASNIIVNAYMALNDIGINIHTLPLVTVGVGFGIDYGLYIVSRVIEEIRIRGDLVESVREALVTSGKAVTFTAVTMIVSTAFWISSNIRFNAEMGLLLAIWMGISYVGSQTLLPILILTFKPKFIMKEANHPQAQAHAAAKRA